MELFPAMPLSEWADTKLTLHKFAQIVGKIRLAASVRRNHWWNVAYHVTGRGITTRPMGGLDENPVFAVDFDFVRHRLVIDTLNGRSVSFPLAGNSAASFHHEILAALDRLGIHVEINAEPFDLVGDTTPFAEDTAPAPYDHTMANRYWRILSQVAQVLEAYAADYSGKTSPVHHFWHTFDVAVTRFSGRKVPTNAQVDPVTREAYSEEVISVGFWFGDDNMPEPAFYSYTAPEPQGLVDEPLRPEQAKWTVSRGSHLAILRYADARIGDDPRATVLEFFRSAYLAGARRANWDIEGTSCPGGVTDPLA
ncbi:DUF5996 family protein [Rhizohabitans arisaemae]|uniref:DUF5996 family protein n=1 Tax=Rhizohabitans arisaemae TaxID=2720610 RepID=UPI0024B03FEB|nr:DUF5996 family protein [Rhizohabitans arisaemae]